ncbi:bifunctional UDP-N-acetylmuramoyl-tripeptide:D-alanyl-D-alanine ligase/alanine racemase [Cytophagaceae bacterium ABcell3]|nr:bifunctional UDP-N-acetylmuramoyl-tripeptide:D-alanyl-D-alanine ligase/alanine racemase [Cytophagaceae bacterium ABcell3]
MLLFSQLPNIVNGSIAQLGEDKAVKHLLFDSRRLIISENALFFAIPGERNNGHKYIEEIYKKGIRLFIVQKGHSKNINSFPEASFIEVAHTVEALQKIAAWHRRQFNLPVVGITGSNAKTIIKEWASQLLSPDFNLLKSPRSYNSQIGVPLSVWQINAQHTLAIFEAGISKKGEMEKLQPVIQPTIGIFTNIGSAHDEGFSSQQEKVIEKLKLFHAAQTIIYCLDHAIIDQEIKNCCISTKKFTWSLKSQDADVFIENIRKSTTETNLVYSYKGKSYPLTIPFTDDASIENVLHCLTLMVYLKVNQESYKDRLKSLLKIPMRLELKQGINNCYIIDDTYNNDLAGLSMAVDFLINQKQKSKKTLILSDIPESGINKKELYKEVASVLYNKGLKRIIGIGAEISKHAHYFSNISTFSTTEDFLNKIQPKDFSDEAILVKGARKFKFENIIQLLQRKTHGTVLEINLDALAHNLNFYRTRLKPGTKVMAMVKAFAYGSGSFETANMLQFHNVDYLAVAYADEGAELRNNGIHTPIMVMNPAPETFHTLIQYKLEPELYNFYILNEFLNFLKSNNLRSAIHIKIDTGMRRLGFEDHEHIQLLNILRNAKDYVQVASIFSHLAAADDISFKEFTYEQIDAFNKITTSLEEGLGYPFLKHICNSAGALRYPEGQFDMVRLGIGLYGIESSGKEQEKLKTVATLKTIISQVKHISKGDTIGYGRKGKAEKDLRIGTIAIGYADGFDRRFSNGIGRVNIKGKLCPVIGNVCMDMTMVDISATEANEGDEVIIFGENPSIIDLAKQAGTIPYEVLTGVGERVKRVYYTE